MERYSRDNTKCYTLVGMSNTKTEQNFNPGLTLIGLLGTGPWVDIYYLLISLDEFGPQWSSLSCGYFKVFQITLCLVCEQNYDYIS